MGGVLINNIHTEKDLKLYYTDIQITHPEPQTTYLQVPGRNGAIDLTEVNGSVCYNNGTLVMTFVKREKTMHEWHKLVNLLISEIHGRKCKITLDSEPDYYYLGRCTVETIKNNQVLSTLTITADCEPFKYDVQSRGEPWLWDTFNFESGVIMQAEYCNVAINGSYALNISHNGGMPVTPVFVCSAGMTVNFNGTDYPLKSGSNKIYDIIIDKDTTLIFKGTGTLTVDYRGGVLM